MSVQNNFFVEASFHDEWARSIDVDNVKVYEFFEACTAPENRYILKKFGQIEGKKVLDLGCGAGEASLYFAIKGAEVIAMDISSEMLRVVRDLASKHNLLITTKQACSDAIDSESQVFDIVYAANLLHHVNIEATLNEVSRVLKKGGIFACWDPLTYNPVINIYRKLASKVRTKNEHPLKVKDLALFQKYFSNIELHMTWFFTLLLFIKFYFIDRVDPNEERYWKKILVEHKRLEKTYNFLEKLDTVFLKIFPYMRKYCWNVTIIASK